MCRITVHNKSGLENEDAMRRVTHVISLGKQSNDGKSYAFATTWRDGIAVYCHQTRAGFSFTVCKD